MGRLVLVAGALAVATILGACAGVSTGAATPARSPAGSTPSPPVASPATAAPAASGQPTAPDSAAPPGAIASPERGRVGLPDPGLTPGSTNPVVSGANLAATACRAGWSSTVRPPVSYTGGLKRRQIVQYGYADLDPSHYQEDHLIPLSLGGAPSDPRNLWPEPLEATLPDGTAVGADVKDGFELWMHDRLCHGEVTLSAAQTAFATDWIAAWEAAGRP